MVHPQTRAACPAVLRARIGALLRADILPGWAPGGLCDASAARHERHLTRRPATRERGVGGGLGLHDVVGGEVCTGGARESDRVEPLEDGEAHAQEPPADARHANDYEARHRGRQGRTRTQTHSQRQIQSQDTL